MGSSPVRVTSKKAEVLSSAFLLYVTPYGKDDEPIGFGKMRASIRERFSLPRLTPQVGNGKPPYGKDDEPIGSRVQLAIWRSQGDLSPTLSEGPLQGCRRFPRKGSI